MAGDYLTKEEGKFLLKVARLSILHFFSKGAPIKIPAAEIPSKKLTEDGACFVTLYIRKNDLRGCIGSLEATRPLVDDVADNAVNSAFNDPRFYPLTVQELEKVRIEISVLTPARKLEVSGPDDLLKKLQPGKHGLIIKKGWNRATFLPVVWEQLPKKEEFLAHLCAKAGLSPTEWKDTSEMEFFVYEAQMFEE